MHVIMRIDVIQCKSCSAKRLELRAYFRFELSSYAGIEKKPETGSREMCRECPVGIHQIRYFLRWQYGDPFNER